MNDELQISEINVTGNEGGTQQFFNVFFKNHNETEIIELSLDELKSLRILLNNVISELEDRHVKS